MRNSKERHFSRIFTPSED